MKGEIIDVVIIIHIFFLVINEDELLIKGYRLGENE